MSNSGKKKIYKLYKEFYGKEPNFNKENFMNLTIEIQAMAYLLNQYGVATGSRGFCYEYANLRMPMSMSVQDIVIKLIENSDDLNDDSLQFTEFAKKTINIVESAIRCSINNSQDQVEELRKIINILYVREHVLPSASDEMIMESEKCTKKDLKDVEQLIKLINQEMCKDNFDRSNIENVRKMIDDEMPTPFGVYVNESGNGELPKITEEGRKKLAKSLINGNR